MRNITLKYRNLNQYNCYRSHSNYIMKNSRSLILILRRKNQCNITADEHNSVTYLSCITYSYNKKSLLSALYVYLFFFRKTRKDSYKYMIMQCPFFFFLIGPEDHTELVRGHIPVLGITYFDIGVASACNLSTPESIYEDPRCSDSTVLWETLDKLIFC